MRDEIKLLSGRWFDAGKREVVVGKSIAARFPGARLGRRILFGRGEWEVVGIMDAGKSAHNSEVFGDLNLMGADYGRTEGFSSVLMRATDPVTVAAPEVSEKISISRTGSMPSGFNNSIC